MIRQLSTARRQAVPKPRFVACEHRTVSRNGRIICAKIFEGESAVSPEVCQTCPVKAIDCEHLRFSLRQTSSSPLIVRFNGRTEVWDDDPPQMQLQEAGCAARVVPIQCAQLCQGCSWRKPVADPVTQPGLEHRAPAGGGQMVPLSTRSPAAATG